MRRFCPSAELREYAEATADDRGWRTCADLEGGAWRPVGADCLLGFSKAPTSRRC